MRYWKFSAVRAALTLAVIAVCLPFAAAQGGQEKFLADIPHPWIIEEVAGPDNGVWLPRELIDSDSNPGRYSRLRVGSGDEPHVFYSTWSPKSDPRYARRLGPGSWSISTIDYATDTYRQVSGDLDTEGDIHALYHDGNEFLYYAISTDSGITWQRELIFDKGAKYASIEVDRKDGVHVVVASLPEYGEAVFYLKKNEIGRWPAAYIQTGSLCSSGQGIDVDVFCRPYVISSDGDAPNTVITLATR